MKMYVFKHKICFLPFSTYSYPHYIILVKGPLDKHKVNTIFTKFQELCNSYYRKWQICYACQIVHSAFQKKIRLTTQRLFIIIQCIPLARK